mgnify:CR=1 FL=1
MGDKAYGVNITKDAAFTRPADTTTYAAGDVVCNSTSAPVSLKFKIAGANNCCVINQALLIDSANVATKPDLELWLFDTDVTVPNDNAAFAPTDAELLTLVGIIEFQTADFYAGIATAGAAGNSVCDVHNLGIPFNLTSSTTNELFGVLVVRNAYVPVSGEVFTIRLKSLI